MARNSNIIKINPARHVTITPICMISFPQLFKPKAFQDVGEEKFSCDLVFDSIEDLKQPFVGKTKKSDGQVVKTVAPLTAINNAKVDQWGPDKNKWPTFNHALVKKGDTRINKKTGVPYDGYAGKIFFKASTGKDFVPFVVGLDGKTPLTEKDIWGGCFVRAHLIARPYTFGNNGVSWQLKGIQKIKDGPKFGGIPTDVFDVQEVEDVVEDWSDDVDTSDSSDDEDF